VDCIIEVGKDIELESICGDLMSVNPRMLRRCTKKGFKMEPVDEEIMKATLNLKA